MFKDRRISSITVKNWVMMMDEFSLIHSIQPTYYKQSTLIKGIGDDAAVFRQPTEDIVTAIDTFVEDVHFSLKTMTPFHIGYRALAANISDLAAMGARPAYYLVSLILPQSLKEKVQDIYQGMKAMASDYEMDLIGGDTVAGTELAISITVIGFVQKGKARYRHHAQENDIVFVTGTLGDSQAGFYILNHEGDYINQDYYIKRHRMPSPRVRFANCLKKLDRVALNDISDGLANEANEIAKASKVDLILYADRIPVSEHFYQFSKACQRKWKYFGGEDFELLGTVSQANWEIVKQIAQDVHLPVTEIGYVKKSQHQHGQVWIYEDKCLKRLEPLGYVHFK